IGVDPYYLIDKSISAGHIPDIIRMAREINDGMAQHAVSLLVKAMIRSQARVHGGRALVLGITFKQNCADIRNTKVIDMVSELQTYGIAADVYDPWADIGEVRTAHGLELLAELPDRADYDAVILAVPHDDLVSRGAENLRSLLSDHGVLFDMKAVFAEEESDLRL
ncbi:MAG: UDP binding domain-containing protein, partial [Tateyamaria sp.]